MKIFAGDFEVITSGAVHSKGLEPIDFVFSKDMTIRLIVVQNKDQDASIDLETKGNVLNITFTNPQVQLHFGPQNPVLVGSYEGRELFVQFRVNTFGAVLSYSVDYSFYMGAKVE